MGAPARCALAPPALNPSSSFEKSILTPSDMPRCDTNGQLSPGRYLNSIWPLLPHPTLQASVLLVRSIFGLVDLNKVAVRSTRPKKENLGLNMVRGQR